MPCRLRPERGILQFAPEFVVARDGGEIVLQPQRLKYTGVSAKRYGRITLFDREQGMACYSGKFGDQRRAVLSSKSCGANVLADSCQQSLGPGQQGWGLFRGSLVLLSGNY